MLNKFIEVYYCDAMRFAKYIQSNHGGDIREAVTSPEGFPTEPKGYEFGDTVHALKIGAYEIAFFTKEKSFSCFFMHFQSVQPTLLSWHQALLFPF